MIAVVDYNTGNLRSVANTLGRLGAEFTITSNPDIISSADRVLLPGVGDASVAMAKLREKGLDSTIRQLTRPVLGICVGMQLLCNHSQEGDVECLGIFKNNVLKLPQGNDIKIPHVGWNTIEGLRSPLFEGIDEGSYVYYTHSYAADLSPSTIASTRHGVDFSAALGRDNFFATQFHPEKSGSIGEKILDNFLKFI